jgi:hypothetical protein
MQAQMEAKLAQMTLKSPGLKSGLPSSPVARNFSGAAANRQSLAVDTTGSSFLSPSDAIGGGSSLGANDAAGVLAQQRAKLKAHRISAPALAMSPADQRGLWGPGGAGLDQVTERSPSPQPSQEITIPTSGAGSTGARPKSTDFSGAAAAFRSARPGADEVAGAALSPMVGDSWANMVNTPLMPMFPNTNKAPASEFSGLGGGSSHVPLMSDAKQFRRQSKAADGDAMSPPQQQQQPQQNRNTSGNWRAGATNGNGNGNGMGGGFSGAKSPALSNVSSNRYGSDDGSMAGLGVGMGGFPGMNGMNGMGSPGMGMPGMAGLAGLNPYLLNMNMAAQGMGMGMGVTPEAQLLAAQMAAAGGFGQPGLSPFSLASLQAQQLAANMNGRNGMRMGGRSPSGGKPGPVGAKKDEEDVDPKLLEDIPAWLRSLRLHKYTPNFEGVDWRDMVMMDEAALEAKGVAALGARRKMLKTFEIVRKKMGMEEPAGSV